MVSIVIVSYNRMDKTLKCIKSIRRHTKIPYKLIIIDNASEKSVKNALIKLKSKDDSIILIFNDKNLGCGLGRQVGLNYVDTEFVAFLDNDMEVTENWLGILLSAIEIDSKIGGICASVFRNEKLQLNGRKIVDSKLNMWSEVKGKQECDIIPGGASIFRAEALRKIEFDPVFTNNFDDLDICMQLKDLGYKLFNCPGVIIHHDPSSDDFKEKRRAELQVTRSKFGEKWGIELRWNEVND